VVAFEAAGFVVAPAFDADALVAEAPVALAAPDLEVALEAAAPVDLANPGLEDVAPVALAAPDLEVALDTVLVLDNNQ
jgi:hypothetical protein